MELTMVEASILITALATAALGVFTGLLWKLNSDSLRRDSANVVLEHPRIEPTDLHPGGAVRFRILNTGFRETHIKAAWIRDEADDTSRVPVTFFWHKRDYKDHRLGNPAVLHVVPFHFIGETLKGGQLWDIEGIPEGSNDLDTMPDPILVIETVLGARTYTAKLRRAIAPNRLATEPAKDHSLAPTTGPGRRTPQPPEAEHLAPPDPSPPARGG